MHEFNDAYVLKQNLTDTLRVYMQDLGINVTLYENKKNWKEQFFYVAGQWETTDNDERLVRSTWGDIKLLIRNISYFIMTLSLEAKKRLNDIQNYLPKKISWRKLLNTLCFVAYRLMRLGSIEFPNRIIHKRQEPNKCKTFPTNFWGRFEVVYDDGERAQTLN